MAEVGFYTITGADQTFLKRGEAQDDAALARISRLENVVRTLLPQENIAPFTDAWHTGRALTKDASKITIAEGIANANATHQIRSSYLKVQRGVTYTARLTFKAVTGGAVQVQGYWGKTNAAAAEGGSYLSNDPNTGQQDTQVAEGGVTEVVFKFSIPENASEQATHYCVVAYPKGGLTGELINAVVEGPASDPFPA